MTTQNNPLEPLPFFVSPERVDALNKERLDDMKSKINELSLKPTVLEHFDKLATLLYVKDGDVCSMRHTSISPSKRLILNYKSNGRSTLSIVDLPKDSKTLDTFTFEELTNDRDILYHLAAAIKEIIDCGTSSTVYKSLKWYEQKLKIRLLLEHQNEAGKTVSFDVTDQVDKYTTLRVGVDLSKSNDDGTCLFAVLGNADPSNKKQIGYYFSGDDDYASGPFEYHDMLKTHRVGVSDDLIYDFWVSKYKDVLEHKSEIKEHEKRECLLKAKLLAALGFKLYLTDCPVLEAVK